MVYYNHQKKGVAFMDYDFLHNCFPNYTLAMWQGNEPKNHKLSVNGDYFDEYVDMKNNGYCQVYHGEAVGGDYKFGDYTIYIEDNRMFNGEYMLHIVHNAGNNSTYWSYRNDNGACHLVYMPYVKEPYISESKIRKILNPDNQPTSKSWELFHKKVMELFELGDWKGEYRDL